MCNLFENGSSSEWLLYISEWQAPHTTLPLSNIRVTTKVAVTCLLSDNATLQDRGTAILYNLAIKEVKTVVCIGFQFNSWHGLELCKSPVDQTAVTHRHGRIIAWFAIFFCFTLTENGIDEGIFRFDATGLAFKGWRLTLLNFPYLQRRLAVERNTFI